jgi:tetratricopeptide (TPR) repeat protein
VLTASAIVYDEPEVEALLLNTLGSAECNLRRFKDSEYHLERALQIYRQLRDLQGEAKAVGRLAWLYSKSGQPEKGVEISKSAIAAADPTVAASAKFMIANSLATCLHELDRPSEALDCLTEYMTQLKQSTHDGMGYYLAIAHRNIGFTHLKLRDFVYAENAFGEALTQARIQGNHYWEAEFLYGLAAALKEQGRVAESRECIARSMRIVDELEETKVLRIRERLAASPLWFEE